MVFYRVHGQVISSDVACHLITERKVMLKHIAAFDFPLQNTSLDLRLTYGGLTS